MQSSDSDLLQKYAHENCEEAFASLISRHLNMVYTAALRQIRSHQLAEEIAQSVFIDLSRNAKKLRPDSLLSAWLYQITRRTAVDVLRRESRRQAREQLAVQLADMNAAESEWAGIEPLLDEAMESLSQHDREALLLRFFENKTLREVGATFGTSEDAAQKRVSRAVEQLRHFFTKRGAAVSGIGLGALLSANAVQAAPVALAATISSAAALSAAAISPASLAVKTIIMTTSQKIIIATVAAVAVSAGVYQAVLIQDLNKQVTQLKQEQKPLLAQVEQLRTERDEATAQLSSAQKQIETAHKEAAAVPKLRGDVSRLTALSKTMAAGGTNNDKLMKMMNDPNFKKAMTQNMMGGIATLYASLLKEMKLTKDEEKKFIDLLGADMGKNMEMGMKVLNGGDKKELVAARAADQKQLNEDLKGLLGEERFAQYQQFGEARPYHAIVDGFQKDLAEENAMTKEQSDQMFQIVFAESKAVQPAVKDDPESIRSNELIERQLERKRKASENILAKAATVLNPAQLKAFAEYQNRQFDQMKVSLEMSKAFMTGADEKK
jgi:RNA polymerase sigma factor (sigma-70 family)